MFRDFFFTLMLVFLTASGVIAQQQMQDVVYLKDGAIIRGMIIEMSPNASVKVQMKDGSVFVFKMENVEKIVKEMSPEKDEGEESKKTEKPITSPSPSSETTPSPQSQEPVLKQHHFPPSPPEKTPGLQANPVKMKRHKNPYASCILSFILPGGGQIYNGEVDKGLAAIALRIIGVVMMMNGVETQTTYYGGYYYQETGLTPGYWVGLAIGTGSLIWSMIDAPISSERINREREREMGLNIKPVSNGDGMMVGLAYRF